MKPELVVDDEPQIRDRASGQGLTDWCVSALRFPQFHRITFRIVQPGKASIGLGFGIDRHFNAGRP
jgi:hypothetical protein